MRRLLTAFVSILLLLLLIGCGSQEPTELQEDDLIQVGVIQVGAESDWRVANSESMKAALSEKNGYELYFVDARQKQENQITAFRRLIQQQMDYIVLMPIAETGWDSVLQEAKEAGVPVIIVDRQVEVSDATLFAAQVGSDFRAEGARAVDWILRNHQDSETVNIVHIKGTKDSTAQLGRTGALLDRMLLERKLQIIAQLDGDFTQAKTYEVLNEYLESEHPEIDVVYCENDNEAFGAIQALEENGYDLGADGVDVVSFDATNSGLKYCMEGKIDFVMECNPMLGPMVAEIIQKLENGVVPKKYNYVEEVYFTTDMLTQELIDQRPY